MPVRDPDYISRANGAWLVVDHSKRGVRLIKKKKKDVMSVERRGTNVQGLEQLKRFGTSSKVFRTFD